jgi:hypothetical protein
LSDTKYSPKESAKAFKKRHGVDRDEYLEHLDELGTIADQLGFKRPADKHEIMPAILSPFNLFHMIKNSNANGLDIKDVYISNSYGLRSDEFISHIDGDDSHVLFAGCSMTFGDGVLLEHLWAHKLYNRLNEDKKLSGYFNIARNGATLAEIFMQTINYVKLFGVPSKIFMLLPENIRDMDNGNTASQYFTDKLIKSLYNALLLICKPYNSKIYMTTWDVLSIEKQNYIFTGEENFYEYSHMQKAKHAFAYVEEHRGSRFEKFFLNAMDLSHPGISEQDFYYHFMFDRIGDI